MQAIVISVGDELVLGQTVDTNAAWLSERLLECGVLPRAHRVVPDDGKALAAEIKSASGEADVVILSGGLGPTPDDLTRPALAEAMGARLALHAPSLERIKERFRRRNVVMPESCRVQAMIPEGASILENSCGSAPGLQASVGGATVFVVPGVPSEMKAMFLESVAPALESGWPADSRPRRCICTLTLHTFGCGESTVAERLAGLMDRGRNPSVGTSVSDGTVSVRIRSDFESPRKSTSELERTGLEIRRLLGDAVFGQGADTLQAVVGRLLREKCRTVATVESCTAGLLGKLLTDSHGASGWYRGGWIVYADELKSEQLGVPVAMLERYGAASRQVAGFMAEQAVARARSDYSLAVTGIAGPGGATPGKDVGTVWIALGRRIGDAIEADANRFLFAGDRESVRDRSAKTALNLLRLDLLKPRETTQPVRG